MTICHSKGTKYEKDMNMIFKKKFWQDQSASKCANGQIQLPRIFASVITAFKDGDVVQTFQSILCNLMINYLTLYKENRNFVILIKLFHFNNKISFFVLSKQSKLLLTRLYICHKWMQ
jgi:hypothetical protein